MDLDYAMLAVVVAVLAVMLVRGLSRSELMLRYPFLAAATATGWFLPQAIGLAGQPDLPDGAYALTMLMVALSLIAIMQGERYFGRPRQFTPTQYDDKRLLITAGVLSAFGGFFWFQIRDFPEEMLAEMGGQATGIITIYYFFSKAQYFGFVIALLLLLKRFSWPALAVTALDLSMFLAFILFGGRRGTAVEVATMILTALWFQRRFVVPRGIMLASIAAGALLINVAGEYRSLVTERNKNLPPGVEGGLPSIEEVLNLNYFEKLQTILKEGSYEVRNAIFYIGATNDELNFDFGLSYWNYLVFRYVPAQLIGSDLKQFLMVKLTDSAVSRYGYNRHIGTTFTGFADAFMSFWLFGCLVFGAISALMFRWYSEAMAGSFEAKLFYACAISVAMQGVTHGTAWFVAFVPQLFLFTMPLLRWAKARTNPTGAMPQHARYNRTRN